MSKTFKVAGITTHNGNAKVRFTDDMIRRIKQFTKGGATRVDFVELPSEMTKLEALEYMKSHELFQSSEDQATINDAMLDKQEKPAKQKREVKVKADKPSLEKIKARAKKQVTAQDILDTVQSVQSEQE